MVKQGGLALSDSEKAEALADSLEAQFQPVNNPSYPEVIEMVGEALQAYSNEPASQPKITDRYRMPSGVSRPTRRRAQTVFRTGH
jgi:hypothetical protein